MTIRSRNPTATRSSFNLFYKHCTISCYICWFQDLPLRIGSTVRYIKLCDPTYISLSLGVLVASRVHFITACPVRFVPRFAACVYAGFVITLLAFFVCVDWNNAHVCEHAQHTHARTRTLCINLIELITIVFAFFGAINIPIMPSSTTVRHSKQINVRTSTGMPPSNGSCVRSHSAINTHTHTHITTGNQLPHLCAC